MHYIMGKNCIVELIKRDPERIIELLTSHKDIEGPFDQISKKRVVSKTVLEKITNSTSHQGYVAKVKDKEKTSLKAYLESMSDTALVLLLDSIEDPQNLGALFRAAECFGVDAVLFSKNRGASITPVVAKASVGASELVTTIVVSNLHESLRILHDHYFTSYVAENESGALPYLTEKPKGRIALIMGSEGKGVQKLLKKTAHHMIYIPLKGSINSLNVSQATAVLLAHFSR